MFGVSKIFDVFSEDKDIKKAQETIDLLVAEFKTSAVKVIRSKRTRNDIYNSRPYPHIDLINNFKFTDESTYSLLHEFAHHLVHAKYRQVLPHGNEFCECLKKVIDAYGVKFRNVNEYTRVMGRLNQSAGENCPTTKEDPFIAVGANIELLKPYSYIKAGSVAEVTKVSHGIVHFRYTNTSLTGKIKLRHLDGWFKIV